ncbi:MAG: heat-inducible transcriptional repressor HrcA [Proteobacteria bacterium]|nr:heat-inducible transcriptional repressor HrcA [Pseudomonadota bacterium]
MPPPDLSRRARKILHAVVSEYLRSGDAIGSRTITRRHSIQLSPATVRNVMADLEDLGLLDQPHTSAGRVPTESGLRFFIDSLLTVRSLGPKEKEEIRQRFDELKGATDNLDDVVRRTSKILSELTMHAGIVLAPDPAMQRLRHIEFRPLHGGKFLCILVTTEGRVENRLIEVDFQVDASRLERIHNYLDELLGGLDLNEVRQRVLSALGAEKDRYDSLVADALRLGKAAFDQAERSADVVVTGQANLLDDLGRADPSYVERIRNLLRALEDKEIMVKLLDQTLDAEGIRVFLGAENSFDALGESSLVAVSYGPEERPIGAIAVIGPMRMNYGKVMSIVDFTADVVSEIISEL